MSSLKSVVSLDSKYNFDELQWVIQIRRTLEEELGEDDEFPVSIFSVPKLLRACDPASYIPQQVALGPYHYWRPELYEMQRYKLAAAKRFQKQLQSHKFDNIIDQLTKLEQRIRACHHKFLDFNGETLVWMMAVDASFLLEFLQVFDCAIQDGKKEPKGKSYHNAILRDIVMLENQIPMFVLRKMMEFKFSSLEASDQMLKLKFIGLFKEISPFKMMEEYPNIQVSKSAHLLDFLYHIIVPNILERQDTIEVETQQGDEEKEGNEESNADSSQVKQLFSELWKLLSKLNKGPVNIIKKLLVSRPMKVFVKLPWKIIINLPGIKILKQPLEYFFCSQNEGENESSIRWSNTLMINKPPSVEEITIPSVTELLNAGVRFLPTIGSISNISFNAKTCTFYLPTIGLDVNTKVFLKNLVAYEASVALGPLVITRYTELMNGIIDSEEDAKALREKGIILNHLKSDKEVANLWNGMSKSLRLSREPLLDKVIEDVNKYYNGRMKVKVVKFMKAYVFSSWQIFTFLATIMLLLLTTLQAFCSVYTCNHTFSVTSE
ncbi:hypothetical protein JHK82_017370 [Glycine max]|uniref:Putative UPF0481 protein n=1 Tax=Glycine soja TaxID=3848 RepID=A0A445JRF9_GLYSO|nr:putative UPF0481 protein At3g02645 [Glycine soja]KAG5021468.1 hypothetical protein JHK85_017810 [Glycine max]KAG5141675.1 hypothetical protein JHK82_017370 [Glycine max]KAH1240415.1 putative UPF0481 protein [Glycine max]KHN01304.1 Putative UPF0481 protein [Glycine soja]RZC01063.1 putative UPF0481 protein [Glycine soja]